MVSATITTTLGEAADVGRRPADTELDDACARKLPINWPVILYPMDNRSDKQ